MAKLISAGQLALKNARPHLETFWYYAKVELAPPKLSEIPQVATGFVKLINSFKAGAWKQVTVKQAVLNTMVTTEVICWFFIGECIGKRHIVGYDLSAALPKGGGHHH